MSRRFQIYKRVRSCNHRGYNFSVDSGFQLKTDYAYRRGLSPHKIFNITRIEITNYGPRLITVHGGRTLGFFVNHAIPVQVMNNQQAISLLESR